MTLSGTPRFITPRVSVYDLLSAMEYRGPVNSAKLLISRSALAFQTFMLHPWSRHQVTLLFVVMADKKWNYYLFTDKHIFF